MIQNGDGNCDQMVEQLRLQVDEAAAVLSRKKISLAGAIYLSNVVVMPSAMYRLKLSTATTLQIDRIQSPLRKVIAKKAHITAAHTNVLFGGYMWDAGGRGGVMKLASSGCASYNWHGKNTTRYLGRSCEGRYGKCKLIVVPQT